ncbi:GDYXXLXY domain-containing protein [Terricaulis silvestris]|uniref:Putative membrane-anchored protein n=1 Tax=Terricaulis silvestris TaxID=2686094 RepID=A0A6I6MPD7_9CAUL|nr:GDYXXLXY domain-containing protein [Terricaulis silvestris]QGZ94647.1 putative membrane-anchored protein [Terricaulis silvestris]
MLNAPLRIMIVAALCMLGLIAIVVREGYERSRPQTETSRDIEMLMQAVDPRALLSGHYVIINLQTRINPPGDAPPCAAFTALADNESWVVLTYYGPDLFMAPRGPLTYAPIGVANTRAEAQAITNDPERARRGLVVRGSAFCSELTGEDGEPLRVATAQTQLTGVQRFYVPQAQAERIDALMRAQSSEDQPTVFAIVNIGRDGRARLKGLNVNGEIIELNWL